MKTTMKRFARILCLGTVFAITATLAQAQTCTINPVAVAQMISPANGSTLQPNPDGSFTFTWCNAGADYFVVVESLLGAHDIFFAFTGGAGGGAGQNFLTLGPACNVPTATNPATQCIPSNGETIFFTLQTVKNKQILGEFKYAFTAPGVPAAPAATTISAPADYRLDASTKSLTIQRGQSGSLQITLTPSNGFDGAVALRCSGLPAGVNCQFAPAQLTGSLDGRPLTTMLVVSATQAIALNQSDPARRRSGLPGSLLAFCSLGLGAVGMVFTGGAHGWRQPKSCNWRSPLLLVCVLLLVLLAGCGGSHSTTPTTTQPATPQSVTALVTASFVGGSQPAPSPTQQLQIQITILP